MKHCETTDCAALDRLQSQTISLLRFPMIAAVVLIHSDVSDVVVSGVKLTSGVDLPVYGFMSTLFVNTFARIAVPLFFFISGYLFFKGADFNRNVYVRKLKSRCRSLLVPYVFWNIVVIFLTFLTQVFLSDMTSGRKKLIADFSFTDWLSCFWCFPDTMPICYPFWFIRNLMILVIVSPLIYYLTKLAGPALAIVTGLLWIYGIEGVSSTGPWSLDGIFFFCFGAYYAIKGKNFVAVMSKCPVKLAVSAYALLVCLRMVVYMCGIDDNNIIKQLSVFVGVTAVILVSAKALDKGKVKVNGLLLSSTFFVYAYHAMPAAFATKMWAKVMPKTDLSMTVGLFVSALVIIIVGVLLYKLSDKLFPRFTAVVTGGRAKVKSSWMGK